MTFLVILLQIANIYINFIAKAGMTGKTLNAVAAPFILGTSVEHRISCASRDDAT